MFNGELILYRTADYAVRLEARYEPDTFWLHRRRKAELWGVQLPSLNHCLKDIYGSGEQVRAVTLRRTRRVRNLAPISEVA